MDVVSSYNQESLAMSEIKKNKKTLKNWNDDITLPANYQN